MDVGSIPVLLNHISTNMLTVEKLAGYRCDTSRLTVGNMGALIWSQRQPPPPTPTLLFSHLGQLNIPHYDRKAVSLSELLQEVE